MLNRPIIGITMGDPAGCGPELTVKALTRTEIYQECKPLAIGDAKVFQDSLRILHLEDSFKLHKVDKVSDAKFEFGIIDVFHLDLVDMSKFEYGKVSKMCGDAAFQCVIKVIDLALKGEIDGTVTNALNKEALNLSGHHFSGHTEIYAQYTHTKKYCMMLADGDLRVAHVSTHVPLRKACDLVKKDRIYEVIKLANEACKSIGIAKPRIAVAGLNPHAGENGLFGTEEIEEIIPAIGKAKKEGIDVSGAYPSDTIFSKARGGWFDIVVVMYHDQGHIPLKVLSFVYNKDLQKWDAVKGVNITLGLPIVRVSVDHGTAFDTAGSGSLNEISLVNSIEYATLMVNNKKK
ncbi:MAG: 4-hydroxythreonine-4-phosphate dehydrogenase PdxA [Peptostreptococcaceae bacterium]|nr:4-hydroxythreonine-4-phosphate dehydrogenase PdxA [Peptostreptococcaceae bacterium]